MCIRDRLPVMEVTVDNEDEKVAEDLVLSSDEQAVELKNSSVEFDKNKQTIMIIDDDPSMLWFVTEIFVGAYNVVSLGLSLIHIFLSVDRAGRLIASFARCYRRIWLFLSFCQDRYCQNRGNQWSLVDSFASIHIILFLV